MAQMTIDELSKKYGITRTWLSKQMGFNNRQHLYVIMERGLTEKHAKQIEKIIRAAARDLSKFRLEIES